MGTHTVTIKTRNIGLVLFVCLLSACATSPDRVEELERARTAVEEFEATPGAVQLGGTELRDARAALRQAEQALEDRADIESVRHYAYVAQRHADIGMERIAEAQAREKIDQSEAERNQVLLTARAREAEQAKARANQATREAERQRQRANEAAARAEDMAASLAEMKAEQTERGIVLTLSDVLFDTDNAQLKPGANNALDSLAEYLADNEARRLLIEGHTDARGSDDYNQRLSQRRAESVRDELIARGIAPDRLTAVGRGEALPVATNETTSGRQQNRRVEILVSDEDGEFPGTDPQASISH